MRDPARLEVFGLARKFAVEVYHTTADLPESERYNLQQQLRRSAVSIVANIAEGCGRSGRGEYEHHLNIALGSAVEIGGLLDLVADLEFLPPARIEHCRSNHRHLVRALYKLHSAVRLLDERTRRGPV